MHDTKLRPQEQPKEEISWAAGMRKGIVQKREVFIDFTMRESW